MLQLLVEESLYQQVSWKIAKKQVLVSTIFTWVIKDNEEAILVNAKELEQITCIQYSIAFPGSVT